jgi:hypothetical protein
VDLSKAAWERILQCDMNVPCAAFENHKPGCPDAEQNSRNRNSCLYVWEGAVNGEYDPSCCRFPKSCSIPPVEWCDRDTLDCEGGYSCPATKHEEGCLVGAPKLCTPIPCDSPCIEFALDEQHVLQSRVIMACNGYWNCRADPGKHKPNCQSQAQPCQVHIGDKTIDGALVSLVEVHEEPLNFPAGIGREDQMLRITGNGAQWIEPVRVADHAVLFETRLTAYHDSGWSWSVDAGKIRIGTIWQVTENGDVIGYGWVCAFDHHIEGHDGTGPFTVEVAHHHLVRYVRTLMGGTK